MFKVLAADWKQWLCSVAPRRHHTPLVDCHGSNRLALVKAKSLISKTRLSRSLLITQWQQYKYWCGPVNTEHYMLTFGLFFWCLGEFLLFKCHVESLLISKSQQCCNTLLLLLLKQPVMTQPPLLVCGFKTTVNDTLLYKSKHLNATWSHFILALWNQ